MKKYFLLIAFFGFAVPMVQGAEADIERQIARGAFVIKRDGKDWGHYYVRGPEKSHIGPTSADVVKCMLRQTEEIAKARNADSEFKKLLNADDNYIVIKVEDFVIPSGAKNADPTLVKPTIQYFVDTRENLDGSVVPPKETITGGKAMLAFHAFFNPETKECRPVSESEIRRLFNEQIRKVSTHNSDAEKRALMDLLNYDLNSARGASSQKPGVNSDTARP